MQMNGKGRYNILLKSIGEEGVKSFNLIIKGIKYPKRKMEKKYLVNNYLVYMFICEPIVLYFYNCL